MISPTSTSYPTQAVIDAIGVAGFTTSQREAIWRHAESVNRVFWSIERKERASARARLYERAKTTFQALRQACPFDYIALDERLRENHCRAVSYAASLRAA